jgi:hypothetical protein
MQIIIKKKIYSIFLIILFIILFWKISLTAAIFWNLFFIFLFFKYDSRYVAAMALMSLASCPFLLIFKKEPAAEQMAIYAYYFLVMTVVLQIAEYRRESKEEKMVNRK